jgi:hypothetical protein
VTLTRRALARPAGALSFAGLAFAPPARARHRRRWSEAGEVEPEGALTTLRLGNPHGVRTAAAGGEVRQVEAGLTRRSAEAGFSDDLLPPGRPIVDLGHRSADPAERMMTAGRPVIDGRACDPHPDRTGAA